MLIQEMIQEERTRPLRLFPSSGSVCLLPSPGIDVCVKGMGGGQVRREVKGSGEGCDT